MLTLCKDYSNGYLKYGFQLLECTWIIHPQHQLPIDGTNTMILLLLTLGSSRWLWLIFSKPSCFLFSVCIKSLLIHLQLFTRLSNTLVFYFCHLQYGSIGGSVGECQLMRCQKHLLPKLKYVTTQTDATSPVFEVRGTTFCIETVCNGATEILCICSEQIVR